MTAASVCVVGSCMVDLVMRLPHRPAPGETLLAESFGVFLGGKGFNQAVAARRMGADVTLIGRVGHDEYAGRFHAALEREGIDSATLIIDQQEGTGIAVPMVEPDGANTIVVAPRANMRLTVDDIEQAAARIAAADTLLVQLETPIDAVIAATRIARTAGRRVILNPAPVMPLPPALFHLIDLLTPNEAEATALAGMEVTGVEGALTAAAALHQRGAPAVIVTLGARGCVAVAAGLRHHQPAVSAPVVDTTAAGDAFNGALAVLLSEGCELIESLVWATAAGACAVTQLGAEPSLPRRAAVAALRASIAT